MTWTDYDDAADRYHQHNAYRLARGLPEHTWGEWLRAGQPTYGPYGWDDPEEPDPNQ